MNQYDVLIIGGGASGAMVALSVKNKSVAIVDSKNFVCKKLLVTGNGKCNLTNENMSSDFYNVDIKSYLSRFDEKKTIEFFSNLGLLTVTDNCGRVYPFSKSAKTVVDVFKKNLEEKNVSIFCGEEVVSIEKNGELFKVISNKKIDDNNIEKIYFAKNVVFSSGGNSCLPLIKKLGIKQTKTSPSLVALKTKENTKSLSGMRYSNIKISAVCENIDGEGKNFPKVKLEKFFLKIRE